MKISKILTFAITACLLFSGCKCEYPEIFIYVRKLSFPENVQEGNLILTVGNMSNCEVKVHPWNATIQAITYTSSDEKVFTVGQTGVVTAVGAGVAELTAMAQDEHNVEVSCTVTVMPIVIPVQEIRFPDVVENTIHEPVGSILKLSEINIEVLPEAATDKTYTLSVGDENIADIENDNLVFKNVGTTTLTATANDGSRVNKTITIDVTAL